MLPLISQVWLKSLVWLIGSFFSFCSLLFWLSTTISLLKNSVSWFFENQFPLTGIPCFLLKTYLPVLNTGTSGPPITYSRNLAFPLIDALVFKKIWHGMVSVDSNDDNIHEMRQTEEEKEWWKKTRRKCERLSRTDKWFFPNNSALDHD